MSNQYHVEIDDTGCKQCGEGRTWSIVLPENDHLLLGISFAEQAVADEWCAALNHAYQSGRQARLAPLREVWEKYNSQTGSYWADAFVTMSAYGSSEHDMRAVFLECWQAIEAACKEEQYGCSCSDGQVRRWAEE